MDTRKNNTTIGKGLDASKARSSSQLSNSVKSDFEPSQDRSATVENPDPDKEPNVTPSEDAVLNPEQPEVIPPPQQYTRSGRPMKRANYDMDYHEGLDEVHWPGADARHAARLQQPSPSSITSSARATTRKGNSYSASAPNRGEDAQVSRNSHSAMVEIVDLSRRRNSANGSEAEVSGADSGGSLNLAIDVEEDAGEEDVEEDAGEDAGEVAQRPVTPNALVRCCLIGMWTLLGGFWILLGLIWRVLKWLVIWL